MAGDKLDPQAFIGSYDPASPVKVGKDMSTTLGDALKAEELLCPAAPADRLDPDKRIRRVAGMLAAGGSLRPEDQHLVGREIT